MRSDGKCAKEFVCYLEFIFILYNYLRAILSGYLSFKKTNSPIHANCIILSVVSFHPSVH